jgi:hypothetical protein
MLRAKLKVTVEEEAVEVRNIWSEVEIFFTGRSVSQMFCAADGATEINLA